MNVFAALPVLLLLASFALAQPCVDRAREVKPVLSESVAKSYEANLDVAREAYTRNPNVAEEVIWYGRRTAYTGEYKDAIRIYTEGIRKFQNDARFYRHRGHRYITLRCFDEAIKDFETAARLTKGEPDVIEQDGLPNARNIPTSTLQSNIWYHLGLAYYLKGDLDKAEKAYREAWKVSKNDDMRVATAYWHYMTLRRVGKAKEAAKVLETFAGDIEVIENSDYLQLIKLYRGEAKSEELLSSISGEANSLGSASVGYGIGNYFLLNGDREKAIAIFKKIVGGDQWASFGYIAAEVELRRLQPGK